MRLKTHAKHVLRATRALGENTLVFLLVALLAGCGNIQNLAKPEPLPGLLQYQQLAFVKVPGGENDAIANPLGGGITLSRHDSSTETALGTEQITATYMRDAWVFNFEQTYRDGTFRDPSGADHDDLDLLPANSPIPGTVWTKGTDTTIIIGMAPHAVRTIRSRGGLTFAFSMDTGELLAKYWNKQECPSITYVRTGDVLEIRQQACGLFGVPDLNQHLYTVTYGGNNQVSSITDRANREFLYGYDGLERLLSVRTPEDVLKSRSGQLYEYVLTWLTAVTNSEGDRTTYEYSGLTLLGNRRLSKVIQVGTDNPTHIFRYRPKDAFGNYSTLHTSPEGEVTEYTYDDLLRLKKVHFRSVDEYESFTYVGDSLRFDSHTTPNGVTGVVTYTNDDIATITDGANNTTTFVRNYEGNNLSSPFETAVSEVRDTAFGVIASKTFAPNGQELTSTKGVDTPTVYTWGTGPKFSQLQSIKHPNGTSHILTEYTELGLPKVITIGQMSNQHSYDLVGNRTHGGNGASPVKGGIGTYVYDSENNPTEVGVRSVDAAGILGPQEQIDITYRSDHLVTRVDRPGGNDHDFGYNGLGYLESRTEIVDGVPKVKTFEYDLNGRRTAVIWPSGGREERAFDQRSRLIRLTTYTPEGFKEGELLHTYLNGQLVSSQDSNYDAPTIYAYDGAGRLWVTYYPDGETLTNVYDDRSRVTSEIYATAGTTVKVTGYTYDLSNRRTQITDDGELVIDKTIVNGVVTDSVTGNGLARSFNFDGMGMISDVETVDLNLVGEPVVATTTILQNLLGNVWEVDAETDIPGLGIVTSIFHLGPNAVPGDQSSDVGKRILSYDNLVEVEEFAFTALSMPANTSTKTFEYNPEGNRLISGTVDGTTIALEYDDDGRVVSRAGVALAWNVLGRLTSYGDIQLEWDMLGNLLSWYDGTTSRHWEHWGGRVEENADGQLVSLDLGDVIVGFGPSSETDDLYRYKDLRGNVQFLADQDGVITTLYGYGPYGVDTVFGSSEDDVTFGSRLFLGGLSVLGDRLMDPELGIFLTPDPIFQLLSQYAYCDGNPIWFQDYNGREGVSTGTAVGVVIVVLAVTLGITLVGAMAITMAVATGTPAAGLGMYITTVAVGVGILMVVNAAVPMTATPDVAAGPTTKMVEMGPGPTGISSGGAEYGGGEAGDSGGAGEGESGPSGAPSGTNSGSAGNGKSGPGSAGGGWGGTGRFGRIGHVSCGHTGIEVLPVLIWFAYRRRRRMQR